MTRYSLIGTNGYCAIYRREIVDDTERSACSDLYDFCMYYASLMFDSNGELTEKDKDACSFQRISPLFGDRKELNIFVVGYLSAIEDRTNGYVYKTKE